jgi:hypothetical protein
MELSPLQAQRSRGAVALARERLRTSGAGRAARFGAWSTALGFAAVAVSVRATDGKDAALAGTIAAAAPWIAWLAGAPLALAAAEDRRGADRREGILALASARGISSRGLSAARVVAAMTEITAAIGAPILALAVLTAALSGRLSEAFGRILLGLGGVAFAIVAGVTLGGLASACARAGGARGRWLFLAVVLLPWMLADLLGARSWSIPGALAAILDFTLRARSGGG